jgi:hypothetical protein
MEKIKGNMMLKITAMIFAITIAAFIFVSCSDSKSKPETRTTTYTVTITPPEPPLAFEDDRIETKNPKFVEELEQGIKDPRSGEFFSECSINKSGAVIGLDLGVLPPDRDKELEKLYPNFSAARDAAKKYEAPFLPSIDMLDAFVKHFNDRMLAGIEEYLHDNAAIFQGGKQGFLKALLAKLQDAGEKPGLDNAAAYIAAAIILGGDDPSVSGKIKKDADEFIRSFESDALRAKPIGFYTWNEKLQRIFLRDRFLQKPFGEIYEKDGFLSKGFYAPEPFTPLIRIAETLRDNPELLNAYSSFHKINEKLCNPESIHNAAQLLQFAEYFGNEEALYNKLDNTTAAFWPFSTSKENRMFKLLYQDFELPRTQIMGDLIEAIRDNRVVLDVDENSGWYDYQIKEIEPLLLPERAEESDKLLLKKGYKKRLKNTFEALLTQRRETHVKQVETWACGKCAAPSEPVYIKPELHAEPAATHYLRIARTYKFVLKNLKELLGEAELEKIEVKDYDFDILFEIEHESNLFYGLYLAACNDLVYHSQMNAGDISGFVTRKTTAREQYELDEFVLLKLPGLDNETREAWSILWLDALKWLNDNKHNFLTDDIRVIVPVLANYELTQMRCWAVLGVKLTKIKTWFEKEPDIKAPAQSRSLINFKPADYYIPVLVFAEVTTGPDPLTREEFRKICDKKKTKEAIIQALEPRPVMKPEEETGTDLLVILAALAVAIVIVSIFIYLHIKSRKK